LTVREGIAVAQSRTDDNGSERVPAIVVLAVGTLLLACTTAAPLVLWLCGPVCGLLAAAASSLAWFFLGPPALPGFGPDLMALAVTLATAASAVVAVAWLVIRWMV
jgi:hypothetical protein